MSNRRCRLASADDEGRDDRLAVLEGPLHGVLARPVALEQGEMRGGDHRLGTQGHRADAKEARGNLVCVAGRDHEQPDEHEEPEDDHQLERHQAFEHRGDLAPEDQRHQRGEEDDVAEHLDDHDLGQGEPRHAHHAIAGQVAEHRRGQRHGGVRRHEGPDVRQEQCHVADHPEPWARPGAEVADEDRLAAVERVPHDLQVVDDLEENAERGEPEECPAVLGGDRGAEEPLTRPDRGTGHHDPRSDQLRPLPPSEPRRCGQVADLPGCERPVGCGDDLGGK